MIARARARLADETGTSLIIVMGLLLLVGLVVTATLTYTSTSIQASTILAGRAETSYDVDGALQAAVNQLRTSDYVDSPAAGGAPAPCPALAVPGPAAGRDVTVTCESEPGSGALTESIDRAPIAALLATGSGARSGEDGIVLASGTSLAVTGDVTSSSTVVAGSGTLAVDGSVRAVRGCTGTVAADSTDCSGSAASVPSIAQPTSGFAARTVPTCPGDGSTVRFDPGYYDDAAALGALMATCSASTFWFPGATGGAAYYFDFHDGEPGHPAGSHTWTIGSAAVRVVGGGTTAPGRPSSVAIPGSCASPLRTRANNGVQFVFGGDSRLRITAGQVELCGPGDAAGGAPPVALFGGDTDLGGGEAGSAGPKDAPSGTPVDSPGMLRMEPGSATGTTTKGVVGFGQSRSQLDRIRDWDDKAVTAKLDGTEVPGGQRGIVTVSGYAPHDASPATSIPAGSTLTYAHLYVRHREADSSSKTVPVAFIQASVTPSRSGAPQVGPVTAPGAFTPGLGASTDKDRNEYRVDTVDLLATSALQEEVTAHGFEGASVQWLVETQDDGRLTAYLDTIQLAIGWTTPTGFRSQRTPIGGANCVALPTTAYPGSGACALLYTSSADGPTRVHVQGAGYAPAASFDLRHSSIVAPVFSSGLVGRQLTFGLTARSSPAYEGLAVHVPRRLRVVLRAYTCPDGGCPAAGTTPLLAAPWVLAGTATSTYSDPGTTIRPGGRAVTVNTWSVQP